MSTPAKSHIAFVGLGVMGYPMAGHLAQAGHQLTVFNRTAAVAERWLTDYKGIRAATPQAAAVNADIVMTCVGNDKDVREVMLGESGVFAGLKAGGLVIDHTTASASIARELATIAHSSDIEFIDAPVSGGQLGAENGQLTIMCGGSEKAYSRAAPLLQHYARSVARMGEAGCGQLTKMVNQICVAGVLQGLAEGLNFGQRAGLDMTQVLDVIRKGAAQSWQMDNRGKTMCAGEFDFGFASDWMRKDLGIVLSEAKSIGADLPLTALIESFYAEVQRMGGGRWDSSALITRLSNNEP